MVTSISTSSDNLYENPKEIDIQTSAESKCSVKLNSELFSVKENKKEHLPTSFCIQDNIERDILLSSRSIISSEDKKINTTDTEKKQQPKSSSVYEINRIRNIKRNQEM